MSSPRSVLEDALPRLFAVLTSKRRFICNFKNVVWLLNSRHSRVFEFVVASINVSSAQRYFFLCFVKSRVIVSWNISYYCVFWVFIGLPRSVAWLLRFRNRRKRQVSQWYFIRLHVITRHVQRFLRSYERGS